MRTLPLAFILAVSASAAGCAASVNRIGYNVEAASAVVATEEAVCPVLITTDSAAVTQAQPSLLGQIRYRDAGLATRCDEARALRLFQADACAVGANVVLITSERGPDFWSSCYRASASLYSVADTLALSRVGNRRDPERLAVNRGTGSGRQLLGVVGYALGFAGGYLLVSLLLGGD